jgi:chromosome segregation ATPase
MNRYRESDAAWASKRLIERLVRAEMERDNQRLNNTLLLQQVEELKRNWNASASADLSNYVGKTALASHEAQVQALNDDLSMLRRRHDAVSQASVNRLKEIEELDQVIKAKSATIENMAIKLNQALEHIDRIRLSCKIYEDVYEVPQ